MKDCKDYKDILTGLFAKIQDWKEEPPTAGTRYRLAGLLADTLEVRCYSRRCWNASVRSLCLTLVS